MLSNTVRRTFSSHVLCALRSVATPTRSASSFRKKHDGSNDKGFVSNDILSYMKRENRQTFPDMKSVVTQSDYSNLVALETGKGIATTGITAAACVSLANVIPDIAAIAPAVWIGAVGASFLSIFKFAGMKQEVKQKENGSYEIVYNSERSNWVNVLYASSGIMLAPTFAMFPDAILPAAAATGLVTAGTVGASFVMPKGSMLKYERPLFGALLGLVGVSFAGIFIPALHSVDVYAGIGMFSLYNMYDTHRMISDYEKGHLDYLDHGVNYYLNFLNIFVRMVEVISKIKSND